MQAKDDSALLAGCQQGSLLARQQLVRQRQDELLRTAFLLTGDPDDAATLAATAFLDLFQALPRSSTDRDSREWLLELLGKDFLAGRVAAGRLPDLPPTVGYSSALVSDRRQHFQVDDERSRVLAALDRLERPVRTVLVLTEFSGLEQQAVARITGQSLAEVRRELATSRERVAEAAGRESRQLRGALSSLATGAPRVDLWPLLEEPLEQLAEQSRQRNRLVVGVAAVLAVMVLLIGLGWLIGGSPFDDGKVDSTASGAAPVVTVASTPAPTPDDDVERVPLTLTPAPASISSFFIGAGAIPDLQVVTGTSQTQSDDGRTLSVTSALLTDPVTGQETLLEAAGDPIAVSADGRWVLFKEYNWEGDQSDGTTTLTAYDTHAAEVDWQRTIEGHGFTAALTPEQAYVGRSDGLVIAYNLQTGIETGRWQITEPIETENADGSVTVGPPVGLSMLYIAPNQRRLHVIGETYDSSGLTWTRTVRTYRLPAMTLVWSNSATFENSDQFRWEIDLDIRNARPVVNGSSFYTLIQPDDNKYVIRFLDLRSGEISDVELPFDGATNLVWPDYVLSNSGQWLYVVSGDRLQVAIVDLLQQRLDRSFPLDYGQVQPPASVPLSPNAQNIDPPMLALSQDGTTLYMTGVHLGDFRPEGTTIFVIDTRTWQAVDRWQAPGWVREMVLHDSIEQIEMYSIDNVTASGQSETYIISLTLDGVLLDDPVGLSEFPTEEPVDWLFVQSLAGVYQRQFGLSPAVGGVDPTDTVLESTLPGVEITAVEPSIAAGNEVEVLVRFTDPVTSQPLSATRPDVRVDVEAGITIFLTHSEADPIILQPVRRDDDSYQAFATLDTPGRWSATVTVRDDGGGSWSMTNSNVVDVIQTFIASDGKRYVPQLVTDPEDPLVGDEVTVRMEFRDIKTGLPLPDDVDFDGALPDEIRVTFVALDMGTTSATLKPDGHGRYQAEKQFRDPADWTATYHFRLGDEIIRMEGATVAVIGQDDEE